MTDTTQEQNLQDAIARFRTAAGRAADFTKCDADLDIVGELGTYPSLANLTTAPFITIYKNNGNDTFTKLANPDVVPTSDCYGVAFSADGKYMAAACNAAPWLIVWKRNGDAFTKVTDPAALPASTGRHVVFWPPAVPGSH